MSQPEPLPPAVPGEAPPGEVPAQQAPAAELSASQPEWNEDLYQAVCTVLIEPEKTASPWWSFGCLGVSILLFVLSFMGSMDLQALGLIIPVLLLHETGHFLGMRAFGYRNVRMFFIPFFGAAVSGNKHASPVWQQAVVLLLGPLPGIGLALALQGLLRPAGDALAAQVVLWLIVVNGANLLPIVPLDGGRLLDVLLFSRRPVLAVGFQLLAVLALFALAVLDRSWVFGGLGALLLLAAPSRYRKAALQRTFRNNPMELPDRLEDLGDEQRRDLFGWADLLNPPSRDPVSMAKSMRGLHESMVSRQPGVLVWAVLLAFYLAGVAGSVAGFAALVRDGARHHERVGRPKPEASLTPPACGGQPRRAA